MTTPAPRENSALIGHEAAEAVLAEAARSGRLHHAWLLTGPPGIGKATLAFRFARWLMAGMPAGPGGGPGAGPGGGQGLFVPETDPVFRRVASGGHADLLALSPNTGEKGKKQMIRVDEVRGLRGFMSLTPAEGGFRVVVLDEPETMDAAGQNAILKTLEEPPARAVLLLACSAPGRLLPTIRSRVRRLELQTLSEPAMAQWMSTALPEMPGPDRAMLARIAGGAPGRALALAEGEGLAMARLSEEALAGVAGTRALALAETVAGREVGPMVTFFALLRSALAAGLRQAALGQAPAWLGSRSMGEWSEIWGRLGAHAVAAEKLSLDRKQAVLVALGWLR